MNDHVASREFQQLCEAADLSFDQAAEYLGLSSEDVHRLQSGERLPPNIRQVLLVEAAVRQSTSIAPVHQVDVDRTVPRTAISLFSGGGGLDIGIERAGFRTLACIEKDANCCHTLRSNQPKFFREAEIINSSVEDVDLIALMERKNLREGELDLLFGGPPCQTFSQIGKLDGINDARGQLLFSMVDYARVLRPKVVLIENVKALLSAKDLAGEAGGVVRQLKANLRQLGYKASHKIINSADFGVPQIRQRLFVVAVLADDGFEFPNGLFAPIDYRDVAFALANLPPPAKKGSMPEVPNHVDVTPAGDRNRISYVPEGGYLAKVKEAPPEVKGRLSPKDTTKFLRLGRQKQSNTLRCGEIFFHPTDDRYLTPREYMRLHGFPDDYHLCGPIRGRSGSVRNLDQHRQVANSVPPPVAEAIGRTIILHMENASDAQFNR